MDEAGDIVGISIPFVSGAAAAAALHGTAASKEMLAGISIVFISIMLIRCCQNKGGRLHLAMLFFAIGLFCGFNSMITGCFTIHKPDCMRRLSDIIKNTGYSRPGTSELVEALITGNRSGLDPETRSVFARSGASHMLALSGLHLGVIYLMLSKLMLIFGKSRQASLARSLTIMALCGGYAYATGLSPSIVRAFIFICLNEAAALKTERKRSSICTFCAAATIQLSVDPSLIGSVSFQLSYLAMLGLTILFPVMDRWYPPAARPDPMRRIWTSMSMSISCQLFTAPVVLLKFGSIPLHFLLANLIAMPMAEILIVSSVVATALAATGICPETAVNVVDAIASLLKRTLEIISGM